MPPRAIKDQLTCPFELTSGSFLIGRRRILVISRNHVAGQYGSVPFGSDPMWRGFARVVLGYMGTVPLWNGIVPN